MTYNKEIERINQSRMDHHWKYELMGEPVTKFPANIAIRKHFSC